MNGRRAGRGIIARTIGGVAGVLLVGAAQAQTGADFVKALTGGQASADLRYRFALISQDNGLKDAKASTLRTRLGYRTGNWSGFSAFLQFSDTRVVGIGDYNSTVNGQTQYSVEADPKLTRVTQAYADYSPAPATGLRLGRQRILFDDARFVGNFGWRQNLQTFDAVSLTDALAGNAKLTYAYVYNVNTVTGTGEGVSAHLINVAFDMKPVKLAAYAYLVGFNGAPLDSNKTIGLRISGSKRLAKLKGKALYALEYAKQLPYAGGDSRIDGDYYLGEVGTSFRNKTIKLDYEVLGADHYAGFQTPLATKHAFNGWADQFLTTPRDGLEDLFFTTAIHPAGYRFTVVYHRFSAQRGGAHYGDELDVQLADRLARHYKLLAEYARYRADRFSVDTDAFWVQGAVAY